MWLSSPAKVTEDTIEKLKEFEQKYGIQDIELTTIVDSDGNNIEFSSNDEAINDYWLKNSEITTHQIQIKIYYT